MARTRTQKWLIGCLSAVGVLAVLSGLALGGFLMIMKKLRTVPPESTQIVFQNDSSERLRIDRILYGEEEVLHSDSEVILDIYYPEKFSWYRKDLFRDQPEMSRKIFYLVHRIDYKTSMACGRHNSTSCRQAVRLHSQVESGWR